MALDTFFPLDILIFGHDSTGLHMRRMGRKREIVSVHYTCIYVFLGA